MFKKVLAGAVSGFLPLIALAQAAPARDLFSFLGFIRTLADTILPLLIAVAVVYFIWQVLKFIMADGEEGKKEAKANIIWGVVGIVVMVSVWGLVGFVMNTLGLNNTTQINLPTLPVQTR